MERLFKLEWMRCRDGYRLDVRAPARRGSKRTIVDDADGTFIVPNSNNWESYCPLSVHAAYRVVAGWDVGDEDLVRLANAYGPMATKTEENIEDVRAYVVGLRALMESVDGAKWEVITVGLNKAGEGKLGRRPGIGRLGVVFKVVDGKPQFKLSPPTLIDGLQAQALFDAAYGIEHKKCRNPECDRWFPTTGDNALRVDAEYHNEACRRRHAYLIKKAKEQRS